MYFLIFGDQSSEDLDVLRNLRYVKTSVVREFLVQADAAIHQQISSLCKLDRENLPVDFSLHQSLYSWTGQLAGHPALRPVWTFVAQTIELLQSVLSIQ